ncbi:MAG: mercuric transport protein periplasmic component [Silicimonas sp.]|nr:mercuric transport protein periplasmic component [Silicimonas sp.]
MKDLILATIFALFVTQPGHAEQRTAKLSVPGMFCASCPFIVQAAINDLAGVISVTANSEQKTAVVVFEDSITTIEAILSASSNAGYEATVIGGES